MTPFWGQTGGVGRLFLLINRLVFNFLKCLIFVNP